VGRGLSDEQKEILHVLPEYDFNSGLFDERGLTTQDIVEALGKLYTKVNQVSVSRSIRRLRDRKLIWPGKTSRTGRATTTWFSLTKEQGEWLHERAKLNRNTPLGATWVSPAEPYPVKGLTRGDGFTVIIEDQ
jgi:hypothetical protein